MSIHCLSHVMKHSEAQLGARLVLFVLAEHAHDDGSESYPSVETLVERSRLSRRSVQHALRRLEADGMITADGLGPRRTAKWRVVMGGADIAPPQDLQGELDDTGGRTSRPVGGEAASPEPSFNPPEPSESPSPTIPREMLADGRSLLRAKRKVERRLVTEDEMWIAAAALAAYNRAAQSDFGLGANLTSIVMRIRERPSWDAAKHVRLVQSAWRVRWWERRNGKRRPTPQVIYGTARVFEQVAQDAADEAAGRKVVTELNGRLKHATYSGGRTWDELTPAEQATARENAAMDVWPEELAQRRQQNGNGYVPASVAASNGHGVNAETWLD